MERTLEVEFSVEREKRYIKQNPERALELALAYFEDFCVLAAEHKKLEQNYKALQVENVRLKSSKTHKSTRLHSFVSPRGKKILIVEIETINNVSFDTEQLREMVVYRNSLNNYFLSTGVEEIERIIVEAMSRLGNNHRHPLLFNVRVVPGDETDALIGSIKNLKNKVRKRRNN